MLGNFFAVVIFFVIVTFFGVGLSVGEVAETWIAPIFAGLLALGVAAFLFGDRAAQILLVIVRSGTHLIFALTIVYLAVKPLVAHPTAIAFTIAGLFSACIAVALYLNRDANEAELL